MSVAALALLAVAAMAGEERVLGDHPLMLPASIDAAVATTHVGFRQGVGVVQIPDVHVQGFDEPYDLVMVGAVETIDVGVRVSPGLGLFGRIDGEVTTGANADSAYFRGARTGLNWDVGAVMPIIERPDKGAALAVRLRVRGTHGATLEPARLVEAVLDDPEATVPELMRGDVLKYLLVGERGWTSGASIAGARVIDRTWAVQGALSARAGPGRVRYFDGEADHEARITRSSLGIGGALGADLAPRLPLGVQLEYRFRAGLVQADPDLFRDRFTGRHYAGLGLYLTAREDLQLGVLASGRLRPRSDGSERFASAEFVIQNYF